MRGFVVGFPDGSELFERGTRYEVDAEGDLILFVSETEARRIPAGDWMEVRSVGTELAPHWPPADLDRLLSNVAVLLARQGDYVHGLGSTDAYRAPLLNDLDSLVAAMLTRVGIDAAASANRERVNRVRELVRRHFHLGPD